jgi:hypothetical protein
LLLSNILKVVMMSITAEDKNIIFKNVEESFYQMALLNGEVTFGKYTLPKVFNSTITI